jgi:hypothetical protein
MSIPEMLSVSGAKAISLPEEPDLIAPVSSAPANSKADMEKVLDIPVEFTIGIKKYTYTSRPIGYFSLIFSALMELGAAFDEIMRGFSGSVEFDGETGLNFSKESVQKYFVGSGEKGIDAMCKIAQLLVEPIDPSTPKAPDMNNMHLTMHEARWNLSASTFAKMLNTFFNRDVSESGMSLKNVLSLSGQK